MRRIKTAEEKEQQLAHINALRTLGIPMASIARRLNISRAWLYELTKKDRKKQ